MPGEVTVGMLESEIGRIGFVTCQYMDKGWLKASTFRRLTGYLPSRSKDSETQFKKLVCNAAAAFPNEPMDGFKIVAGLHNAYKYNTLRYKEVGDAVLQDPRGFKIGYDLADFTKLLSEADMSNGKLLGKYAYAWTTSEKKIVLLKEGTPEFDDALKCREEFESRERSHQPSLKKNELAVGKAYHAVKSMRGDWIYAGMHDTYSGECHMKAFYNGKYDVENSIEEEKSWPSRYYCNFKTSLNSMVFFPAKYDAVWPWKARRDVSGMFEREVPLPDGFYFPGFGSSLPPTLESIDAAMSVSPAFQRIDFIRFSDEYGWEPVAAKTFYHGMGLGKNLPEYSVFPIDRCFYTVVKAGKNCCLSNYAECWTRISINVYGTQGDPISWRVVNLTRQMNSQRQNVRHDVLETTWQGLYSMLSPVVPVLHFENGKRVSQQIAMLFIPEAERDFSRRI